MEALLDIFLFHSLQRLVQFSSVTSWCGFCLTISLMGSLGVLSCVFYASPKFNHEYSASLRSCGQIDFPFASRHFSRPLQIGRVHIEFVQIAENYTEPKHSKSNGRRDRSRVWRNCGKSSLQSKYLWHSANRNTLRPICANFPFLCIELNLLNSQLNSNHGRSTNSMSVWRPTWCWHAQRNQKAMRSLFGPERVRKKEGTFSIKMRRRASA